MADSDWWARRLGRVQTSQQPPAPVYHSQNYRPDPVPQHQQTPQYQSPPQSPSIRVTPENLYEATKHWQGGEAHRRERHSCPQCGGGHFFSRAAEVSRGPAPAPLCYDCGYTGLFRQGDPSNYSA